MPLGFAPAAAAAHSPHLASSHRFCDNRCLQAEIAFQALPPAVYTAAVEVSAPLANQTVAAKREFTFVLSRPPIMPLLRSLPSPRAYADVRGDAVAGFSLFHGARLVYALYTAAAGRFHAT